MRRCLLVLLLCTCAIAQTTNRVEGPDFSRAARPRGGFYLNGIGHQYLQGTNYTIIAAATPVLDRKFFGVKVHVINRSKASVDVLPDAITAEDSVSGKQLALYSSTEVNEKLIKPSGMGRLAGVIGGDMPGAGSGVPTVTDLMREIMREAAAESPWGAGDSMPALTPRGPTGVTAKASPVCDLGCELRNREIGDGSGPQLAKRVLKPEQIEKAEFLANTVPPDGDAVGVLYFAMPKMTDHAPISRTGRKSYQVTVTVPVGGEKFQFVFPPE